MQDLFESLRKYARELIEQEESIAYAGYDLSGIFKRWVSEGARGMRGGEG